MHYLKKPISIQFELSNVCQALCLGCSRTLIDYDKLKTMQTPVTIDQVPVKSAFEGKEKVYLKLDALKNALTPKLMESIKDVYFIGTVDDPFAHPQLVEYIEWLVTTHPQVYFCLHTNGGLRNPEYFKELALVLKKHNNYKIWFSIDGLEDTNHLYRIGAKWDKLMANTEAFINAGGRARWQFITFNHNSHQLQKAKDMAKELGFSEFIEKMSFRFLPIRLGKRHAEQLAEDAEIQMLKEKEERVRKESNNLLDTDAGRVRQTEDYVQTTHKMVKKMGGISEHTINIDEERKNRHPDREMLAGMRADGVKGVKGVDHFSKKHKIICQNRTEPRIYVSFDGKIWPCNWLGGIEYYEPDKNPYKQYWPIPSMVHHGPENGVPMDFNSLYAQDPNDPSPVKTILESPWYSHLLEEDWSRSDDPNGSLQPSKCKQMCHTELGTGIFEKMRRNEQNLVTGEYSDVAKTHGLTPPQGGSGFGEGSAMRVDETKLFKVNDIVASENYDDNSENKIVGEKDIRIYRYYKEVEPGKFVETQVDDERGYNKDPNKEK